jgi:hypothetical protein
MHRYDKTKERMIDVYICPNIVYLERHRIRFRLVAFRHQRSPCHQYHGANQPSVLTKATRRNKRQRACRKFQASLSM